MGISLEYIAGFIDGEGYFYADTKLRCSPHLGISNTNKKIIYEIKEFFESITGIRLRIRIDINRQSHHSVCYYLIVGARTLRIMLKDLAPLLHIKREQADIVQQILDATPTVSGPGHTSNFKERTMLTRLLRQANVRGHKE